MTRQQLLDLYFLDARAKLIDIAAFLDRLERATGEADFRLNSFMTALEPLRDTGAQRARQVLLQLSDATTAPVPKAATKGACGAWAGSAH